MDRALLVKNAVSTVSTIKTFAVPVVHSTINVATGRRKLIICALWTEICMAFTALDALREGYEVYPVVDAIAGALLRPGPLDQEGTPSQALARCQPHKPRQAPPVRHDPAGRNQHMHGCGRKIGAAVLRSRESP